MKLMPGRAIKNEFNDKTNFITDQQERFSKFSSNNIQSAPGEKICVLIKLSKGATLTTIKNLLSQMVAIGMKLLSRGAAP